MKRPQTEFESGAFSTIAATPQMKSEPEDGVAVIQSRRDEVKYISTKCSVT